MDQRRKREANDDALLVNDLVEAKAVSGKWWDATITRVHEDGTFDMDVHDGYDTKWWRMPRKSVRAKKKRKRLGKDKERKQSAHEVFMETNFPKVMQGHVAAMRSANISEDRVKEVIRQYEDAMEHQRKYAREDAMKHQREAAPDSRTVHTTKHGN